MKLVAALRRALALVVESLVPSGQDSTDSESRDAAARWGQQGDGQDDLDAGFSGDSHYKCNSCFVDIPEGTDRYHCQGCDESHDLCAKCFLTDDVDPNSGHQNGKQHTSSMGTGHTFIIETRSPQKTWAAVRTAETLQELLLNTFMHYADRRCFGVRDSATGQYVWNKYSDQFTVIQQVATGLDALEADLVKSDTGTDMVGLCGNSSAQWYTAQMACTLLGKPTVSTYRYHWR
eukprot:scpid28130/ scgid4229/ 